MTQGPVCPVCSASTRGTTIPVRVERGGREIFKLLVPARQCEACEYVALTDDVTEDVIAALEENSEPGDDIILPAGETLH